MKIEKKTLGCRQFDKLYKSKDLIPDEFTISDKTIASRYEAEGCRFLFVQNEADGLVYCYFQPSEKDRAVMISRGTVDKALNIYKGTKFLQSINVNEDNVAIAEALAEMQTQPDFMVMFAQVAKKATVVAQTAIAEESEPTTTVVAEEKETRFVEEVNNLIGEGMRMKKSMTVEGLLEQRAYLVGQRNELLGKYALLEAQVEQGKSDLATAEELLEETAKYVDALTELREQYAVLEGNYDQLGEDYLALEAEKEKMEKAHAKEIKEFNEMYKELWQKFLSHKKSLHRHSQGSMEGARAYAELSEENVELGHKFLDLFAKLAEAEKKLATTTEQLNTTGNHMRKTRKEYRATQDQLAEERNRVAELSKKLKKSESEYAALKTLNEKQLAELVGKCLAISGTERITDDDLLEILNAFQLMAAKNKELTDELDATKLKKAKDVADDINKNKDKVFSLVRTGSEEKPVYLVVGPHYDESMRKLAGKDGKTLYVITGGDPTTQLDEDKNIIDIEDLLVDDEKRKELEIRAVHEIQYDKKGNAKIIYWDKNDKGKVSANYSLTVKDVDVAGMTNWVRDNYAEGKTKEIKVLGITSTLKAKKNFKIAAISLLSAIVIAACVIGHVPNQSAEAKEYGATKVTEFVMNLEDGKSLFQYAPEVDAYGTQVNYVKSDGSLVPGNKVTAIGSANGLFYREADGKITVPVYEQKGFGGWFRDYSDDTILGAAGQLGAEVVAELTKNNVPVYQLDKNGEKQPIYCYLNDSTKSDYASRDAMIKYLEANGYKKKFAEKIVAEYEKGFKSGLNNGLSNKVENIIGSNDVVTPEVPPVSFVESATQTAIANKIAANSIQGAKYSADEFVVVYSDLDTNGEQVLFVMANKKDENGDFVTGINANKYLYKIVLGDGSTQIDSTNINEAIANAKTVTESIKLDFMFKAAKYAGAIENFYDKNASGSIAYVSNYALSQAGESYTVSPTITVYNGETGIVTEESADYTVKVAAGEKSSITEMCAVALLSDYGYFDDKGIYVAEPISSSRTVAKVYSENERTLGE